MSSLTPKQEKFALRYLECGDASEAYKCAYSCSKMKKATITRKAFDVLHLPKVQAYLDENREAAQARTGITIDRVLREYGRVAFTHLPGIIHYGKGEMSLEDFENLSIEQKACIKKFKVITDKKIDPDGEPVEVSKVEVELHDKLRALDSIAKHLGMFIDRSEIKTVDETEVNKARDIFATMTTEEKLEWLNR